MSRSPDIKRVELSQNVLNSVANARRGSMYRGSRVGKGSISQNRSHQSTRMNQLLDVAFTSVREIAVKG